MGLQREKLKKEIEWKESLNGGKWEKLVPG